MSPRGPVIARPDGASGGLIAEIAAKVNESGPQTGGLDAQTRQPALK